VGYRSGVGLAPPRDKGGDRGQGPRDQAADQCEATMPEAADSRNKLATRAKGVGD